MECMDAGWSAARIALPAPPGRYLWSPAEVLSQSWNNTSTVPGAFAVNTRLVRFLHDVEKRGPRRFTDFLTDLELRSNAVDRVLKTLVRDGLLVARVEPGQYPQQVRYELTTAGKAELKSVRRRVADLKRLPGQQYRVEAQAIERALT